MKEKILITMGDPAGIGPEIILKYFINEDFRENNLMCAVCGSFSVLNYYKEKYNFKLEIVKIDKNSIFENKKGVLYLIDEEMDFNKLVIGQPSEMSGKFSMKYLETAIGIINSGLYNAITTAPISKDAINMAGYKYSGHTSYFAKKTGTEDFAMVLKGNKITVVLNTTHLSLSDAIEKVKKDNILKKIILAEKVRKMLGINTKIAVAGLNPHNGENGLFGREEIEEIAPAVKEAQKMGIDAEGPLVPDTLFVKMLQDKYHIAVVMYHDQGLIPMKMESFGKGVNISVGLPFVRTSVDHGTAFDIAGKGIADYKSLKEAVETSFKILKNQGGE